MKMGLFTKAQKARVIYLYVWSKKNNLKSSQSFLKYLFYLKHESPCLKLSLFISHIKLAFFKF